MSAHPNRIVLVLGLWRESASERLPFWSISICVDSHKDKPHDPIFSFCTYQGEVYSILLSPGTCAAMMVTVYPASTKNNAFVRPITPALEIVSLMVERLLMIYSYPITTT